MIGAFLSALDDLRLPGIWKLLGASALLALAILAALAGTLGWLVTTMNFPGFGWLETAINATAFIGLAILSLLMMPAATGAVANLLLDSVVDEVERANYPSLGGAREQPLPEALVQALRFLGLLVIVNLLALPFYFVPGLNLVVWLTLNGILLSREYFDLVAARWLEPAPARVLRRSNRGTIFMAGVVLAAMLLVPFFNLLVPVLGAAFMAHVYHRVLR